MRERAIEISKSLTLSGTISTEMIKDVIRIETNVFNIPISDKELNQLVITGMLEAMRN